jgi:hypothetical protein
MLPHHLVHDPGETPARQAPLADLLKAKVDYSTQPGRSKVLVGNRIPPFVQQIQVVSPSRGGRIMGRQFIPEVDPEAAEVGPKTARLGVAVVQLAGARKFGPHQIPQPGRRGNYAEEMVDALRVQVAAVSLKL